jgi:hypothetical protein
MQDDFMFRPLHGWAFGPAFTWNRCECSHDTQRPDECHGIFSMKHDLHPSAKRSTRIGTYLLDWKRHPRAARGSLEASGKFEEIITTFQYGNAGRLLQTTDPQA